MSKSYRYDAEENYGTSERNFRKAKKQAKKNVKLKKREAKKAESRNDEVDE